HRRGGSRAALLRAREAPARRRAAGGDPMTDSKGSRPKKGREWRAEDPNLALEQMRYAHPIASRELILRHLSEANEPLTVARLAKRLGLHTDGERDALAKRPAAMVRG